MPKPLFRFMRTADMAEGVPPEPKQVRAQFDTAKMIQDAFSVLVGKVPDEYDAILDRELGTDIQSLRKLARGMGVKVIEPGWFAALIRG